METYLVADLSTQRLQVGDVVIVGVTSVTNYAAYYVVSKEGDCHSVIAERTWWRWVYYELLYKPLRWLKRRISH